MSIYVYVRHMAYVDIRICATYVICRFYVNVRHMSYVDIRICATYVICRYTYMYDIYNMSIYVYV